MQQITYYVRVSACECTEEALSILLLCNTMHGLFGSPISETFTRCMGIREDMMHEAGNQTDITRTLSLRHVGIPEHFESTLPITDPARGVKER